MGIKRRRYCEGDVADVSKRIGNTNLYKVRRSVKADEVDFLSFKKWKSQIAMRSLYALTKETSYVAGASRSSGLEA
jgi:hypothetical protein